MAGTVMPAPKFIGLDNNANPVSGGKLYTYVAGTTTPQATYSDVNLTVANANPVVLDSAGRATVFLSGSSYKFVLKDSDDVTIWTQDNVQAVAPFSTNLDIQGVAGEAILAGQACYLSDGSGALTAGRWYLADADNAYSSSLPQVAMAPDAIDAGETGTFRLQGSVTKSNAQADFVVGDTYYVSATAGLLSLSPGTNVRVMGQADSTTTIVISPNPPNIATTPTFIDGITVTSTDAGAAAAPYLDLYRESPSPAASDQIGEIKFSGEDSAGNKQLYARVYGQIADPTSTSEDGQVRIATMKAGVETTHLVIDETGQVLPDQAGQALGSATKQFADLFLESGAVVNFDNGNTTLTHSAGKLTLSGSGAGALDVKGTLSPTANDGAAIGSGAVSWADLFLASGGVINFNNGDVTVTHSTNTLTFAGASSGYIFNDGNVGIGVTPNAGWESSWRALQMLGAGALSGLSGLNAVYLTSNTYFLNDQTAKYIATDFATQYQQYNGEHRWSSAPSGTAGNAITFTRRMTIDNSGNVGIGVTPGSWNSSYKALQIGHSSFMSRASGDDAYLNANAVYGASNWTYVNSSFASRFEMSSGNHSFFTAPSGTAGNTITWTERFRILNGGDVAIGATAKLYLDGVAGTGDTYITESSANTVRGYVGGTFAWQSGSTIWYHQTELSIPAAKKFYVDGGPAAGGGDTYITEYDANRFAFYAGNTLVALINSASIDSRGTLGIGYYAASTNTSTGTAVVRNGTDGYLYLTSSSRRFKENISAAVVTDAQLDAFMATTPSWWDYKGQKNGALGFIAEDLAALPMERYGFNPLINYDAEGQIESNRDYALIAMHHLIIQRLERKIAALEARIH